MPRECMINEISVQIVRTRKYCIMPFLYNHKMWLIERLDLFTRIRTESTEGMRINPRRETYSSEKMGKVRQGSTVLIALHVWIVSE